MDVAAAFGATFTVFGLFALLYIPINDALSNSQKKSEKIKLFRTEDEKEYHSFLENLDVTKYEIIDISPKGTADKFYIITYRTIAESKESS